MKAGGEAELGLVIRVSLRRLLGETIVGWKSRFWMVGSSQG